MSAQRSAAEPGRRAPVSGASGRDLAGHRLRSAIARGELVPAQRLVEAELAARYGVTRNGVRLAIDTLIADGLAERIANQGARIRTVSTTEAIEITECRMVLEGLIARKAAERITDDEAAELSGHSDLMRTAVLTGDLMRYSDLIAELYDLLRKAARQSTAAALIDRLQAQIVRHQFALSLRPGRSQRSFVELADVVRAVSDRDPDRAEAAVRSHLQGVVEALGASDERPTQPPLPAMPVVGAVPPDVPNPQSVKRSRPRRAA